MRSEWRAGISAAVVLCLAGSASAQEPLGEIQSLLAAGDRVAARAQLDSLLAEPLDETTREEAELLRAVLEPDGADYEQRLRALLDRDMAPQRQGLVHLALGQIAFMRGDLQLALKAFRTARDKGKEEEGSLWEGLTALALGDGEAARSALETAQKADSRTVRQRALIALGDSHRAGGEWAEARERYEQAAEAGEPGSGWWAAAIYFEAECLQELGEEEEAKELLQLLIETMPEAYESPLAEARLAALGGPGSPFVEETEPEDDDGAPKSEEVFYTIQVGAFGQNENAGALAARVRERGFAAVRVVEGADGLYRVFLGRYADREQAESLGDSLGAELRLGFSVVEGN